MSYTNETPNTYLSNLRKDDIKGIWRLEKAINKYNASVDKENRLERVKDLFKWDKEELIKLLGIGPKTAENTINFIQNVKDAFKWELQSL
jgi:DNA uptake protein ComE-like DNA-binding protein